MVKTDRNMWNKVRVMAVMGFFFIFCQFTICLTVKQVISKCDTNVRLGGGNCRTAVLTHLLGLLARFSSVFVHLDEGSIDHRLTDSHGL
jgi:hypothetical protein